MLNSCFPLLVTYHMQFPFLKLLPLGGILAEFLFLINPNHSPLASPLAVGNYYIRLYRFACSGYFL